MPKLTDQELKEKSDLVLDHIQSGSPKDLQNATELLIQIVMHDPYFFDELLRDIQELIEKNHDQKKPEVLTKFLERFIAILLKVKDKSEYHHCLLGFLYNIKDIKDKTDSIHYHRLAIYKNPKFLPSYVYLGLAYLDNKKTDDALTIYLQVREIGEISSFSNGSRFYINLISTFLNLNDDPFSPYFDKCVAIINDSLSASQSIKDSADDIFFQKFVLSNMYLNRSKHQTTYEEKINDLSKAIEVDPSTEVYKNRSTVHAENGYFFKSFQDSLKFYLKHIAAAPFNFQNSFQTSRIKLYFPKNFPLVILLLNLHDSCKKAEGLVAFITTYNNTVAPINAELTKLISKDKMEKLTLLEDLNAAKLAKKSHAEMIRIYNKHVPLINKQLTYFDLPLIENLVTPPSLLSLAGLVAAKSDLFRTSKITLPKETIAAVDNDPFIQLISPKP